MTAKFRIAMVLVLALAPACKKDKTDAGPAASASVSPGLANAEPGLLGEIVAVSKACKVAAEASTVSCPKGENRKLINQFISGQKQRTEALPTLTAALSHQDPAVRVVAANVLYGGFRSAWTDAKPGSVKPEDAEALTTAAFKLPKAQARQVIPAAVHASTLAGKIDSFEAALAKTTEPEFKTISYRHYMTHGRLEALKKVQEAAKSQNPAEVLSALESPRNMQAWTAEEQAAVCPWAADFLSDTRPSVASRAASILGNCGGEFVDKLLVKGEAALKEGKFTSADVSAYRELCGPKKRGQPNGPTEQQCGRARKLLEKAVETKGLDVQVRATALTTLAYQWPDDATIKLAKKLEKNPEKVLAEQATRTVQRLEQRAAMGSAGARLPLPPGQLPPGLGSARLPMRRMPERAAPRAPEPTNQTSSP